MYLIYLDESGTSSITDDDKFYCLGGLVVCEKDWKGIDCGVQNIKKKHGLMEIKLRKLYNRNKDSITNNIESKPRQIIDDVYDLISKSPLTLFCMSIDKVNRFHINKNADIEYMAWESLVNRLNIAVDKMCKKYGNEEFGLIIMDETSKPDDERLLEYLHNLREFGTDYQIIDRIIEDPVFTPSNWRNLTQLADAVVCCCKFHIYNEPIFNTQFHKIKDKFSKGKDGSIYNAGFRIW